MKTQVFCEFSLLSTELYANKVLSPNVKSCYNVLNARELTV